MVKSHCTTEGCLKPERERSLCRTVCGAACVKIDGNTSIPQSLLATVHREKKQAVSSCSLESRVTGGGTRTRHVCIPHKAMFSESLGNLGKQVKLSVGAGEMEPN